MRAKNLIMTAALVLTAGCGKNGLILKTDVKPDENISSGERVMLLDGSAVGFVRGVKDSVATLEITNRSLALPVGTVHLDRPDIGIVLLDMTAAHAGAPALRDGDFLPTQTPVQHLVQMGHRWGKVAVAFLALAVILTVCLLRWPFFGAVRALASPFVLAFVLACFTGWALHPVVAPLVRGFTDAHFVSDGGNNSGASASATALDKYQVEVAESLAIRPDPNVVAFVLVTVIALPIFSIFIFRARSLANG